MNQIVSGTLAITAHGHSSAQGPQPSPQSWMNSKRLPGPSLNTGFLGDTPQQPKTARQASGQTTPREGLAF